MANFEWLASGVLSEFTTAISNKIKGLFGTTDISSIGDGTVSGALKEIYDLNTSTSGVTAVYTTDSAPFTETWLSLSAPTKEMQDVTDPETGDVTQEEVTVYGTPITPETNKVYMILSDGDYLRQLVMWDSETYVRAGNVNKRPEYIEVPIRTETGTLSASTGQAFTGTTRWSEQFIVRKGMERLKLSASGGGTNAGSRIWRIYWKGDIIMENASPWSRTIELEPSDVGSVLQVYVYANAQYNLPSNSWCNCDVTAEIAVRDYETYDFVPSTETADAQAGLVPSNAAGTDDSTVLTAQGWDEHKFNLTDAEITNLFARSTENAAGPMYVATQEFQRYSTDEIVVGEWTDGKPLYRKNVVANVTLSGTSIVDVQTGLTNACNVVNFKCNFFRSGGGVFSGAQVNTAGMSYCIGAWMDDAVNIRVRGGNDIGGSYQVVCTLEYTKTTDTASSPKVPYEPLVEYSESEKLIGYWIDGKPLYRRVIVFTTPINGAASAWKTMATESWMSTASLKGGYGFNDECVIYPKTIRISGGSLQVWESVVDVYSGFVLEYTKTTS